MGIASGQNRLWDDVLENGPSSLYSEFFDIDWAPPKEALGNRVLLPILGDQYGQVLERGELQRGVGRRARFKVALLRASPPARARSRSIAVLELLVAVGRSSRATSTAPRAREHPLGAPTPAARATRRARGQARASAREGSGQATPGRRRRPVGSTGEPRSTRGLRELNGSVGPPASFDGLDALLQDQSYRLASWRVAADEINYRRFFDVNDLAAIRMERGEGVRARSPALVPAGRRAARERHSARSHGRPLRPVRLLREPAAPLSPGHGQRVAVARTTWRGPCRSSSRRSSNAASRCPRPGPWTAPPATNSPTPSRACSWTRPRKQR